VGINVILMCVRVTTVAVKKQYTVGPRFTKAPVYEQIFRAKKSRVTNGVSDYEHNLATAAN
jgi:hypothetical protein